eukprot:GEMP01038029.1.p1 GENE.GEMP01038029.1~~GEMP01038029.1.p1  ORF type:complete len:187 (+),score=39.57 GEMP01038029.1:620-1180(+)
MQGRPDRREETNVISQPNGVNNSYGSVNQNGQIGGIHHQDNRSAGRNRSRSPATRVEEQAAFTAALLQSATALPKAIDAKRTVHLSSFSVAQIAHDIYGRNIAKALPPLVTPPFPTIAAKASAKASAKAPARASAQTPAKAPAKASTKASAKTPAQAPAKASAKTLAQAPAKAVAKTRAKVPAKAR